MRVVVWSRYSLCGVGVSHRCCRGDGDKRQLMSVVVFEAAAGSAAMAFAAAILRMLRDAFAMLCSVAVSS